MKPLTPKNFETLVIPEMKEWIPRSFAAFLDELQHVRAIRNNSLLLYRGHREKNWVLDSTFVRSCKQSIFGLSAEAILSKTVADSIELHYSLLNLLLLKYGVQVVPSRELKVIAENDGIDPWFELMKRYQQYPEEDRAHLKGSHILDWSQSPEIALYFANRKRNGEGAVFLCDATAAGNVLQVELLGNILDKMKRKGNAGQALGCPLLFYPEKQIKNDRANNQKAVYFAQMDMRLELEEIWRRVENENGGKTIIVKLVLPSGSQAEVHDFLQEKGIVDTYIFPDSCNV